MLVATKSKPPWLAVRQNGRYNDDRHAMSTMPKPAGGGVHRSQRSCAFRRDSPKSRIASPPSPKQSGGLGCITLLLSFSIAVAASVIVGGIAELTNGTNFPAQGLKPGDTGIYSGIATFIVGMIALFSVFVWRQARNDAILKTKLVIWHQQKLRYENDYYCPHCQFRGSLPLPSDNKG